MKIREWKTVDCIHKDVCFYNGVKCSGSVCRFIQPEVKKRTCVIKPTSFGVGVCSNCGEELTMHEGFDPWANEYAGKYCIECGVPVVKAVKRMKCDSCRAKTFCYMREAAESECYSSCIGYVEPERTCKVESCKEFDERGIWAIELSCGHADVYCVSMPNRCSHCGAKVIGDKYGCKRL